jgi:hypothetical protein
MVQPKYNPQEALERVKLMMNYDLSKTSTENKKVIEEQQTEEKGRFSCIKNYFNSEFIKPARVKEFKYKTTPGKGLMVTFEDDETWFFNLPQKIWRTLVNGKFVKTGKWECDGNKNFVVTNSDGTIYKSSYSNYLLTFSNPNEIANSRPTQTDQPVAQPAQTQPVAQPVQTQPVSQPVQTQPKADKKQDTPDPSKPQKLKPKDSPLGTTLKDTSIPKRSCVVYVDQLFEAWERSRGQKFDTNQINELRGYVQRCMDDHFPSGSKQGNWGITGLGGGKTDQKLLQLSACKSPAPSQSGPDSIFRLARKC